MKNFRVLLSLVTILFFPGFIESGFWSSTLSELSSDFSGFAAFGEGMAESFGMNPPGFNTNLRFFNNSEVPAQVCLDRMKKYQGTTFHQGNVKTVSGILPGQDTGTDFTDMSLYLRIVMLVSGDGGASYSEIYNDMVVSQEPQYKHCKDTYVYNFYSSPAGPQTEYLGYNKGVTGEFYGQIYNGLSEPCYIRYTFNNEVFTVMLDPNTFNFLQSDSTIPRCIRPGNLEFTFADGSTQTVSLSATGVGDNAGKNAQGIQVVTPMQYHYEIYRNVQGKPHVYCTGLGIGAYKPSANGDIRLITPVTCSIWNKSVDQVPSYPDYMAIESNSRTVWFAYGTPGWADITTGVKNCIIGKVPYGEAVTFKIIRPTILPYKVMYQKGMPLITQKLSSRDVLTIADINVDSSKSNITDGYYQRTGRILQWGGTIPANLNAAEEREQNLLGQVLAPVNLYEYMGAISQTTGKAQLFIISLDTGDEKKARRYMEKVLCGEVSYDYAAQDAMIKNLERDASAMKGNNQLSKTSQADLLSQALKTDYGIMFDTETGVSGHPLVIDTFIPYGNGYGPYYYTVEPPMQSVSLNKLLWLQTYLTQDYFSTSGQGASFSTVLQQWIQTVYNSDTVSEGIKAVYPDVVSFLQQNGTDSLFTVTQGAVNRKQFSGLGNYVVTTLLAGPSSIVNAPLYWGSGVSSYVISGTSQPTQFDPTTNTLVSAWKPKKTTTLNVPSSTFSGIQDHKLGLGDPFTYS